MRNQITIIVVVDDHNCPVNVGDTVWHLMEIYEATQRGVIGLRGTSQQIADKYPDSRIEIKTSVISCHKTGKISQA